MNDYDAYTLAKNCREEFLAKFNNLLKAKENAGKTWLQDTDNLIFTGEHRYNERFNLLSNNENFAKLTADLKKLIEDLLMDKLQFEQNGNKPFNFKFSSKADVQRFLKKNDTSKAGNALFDTVVNSDFMTYCIFPQNMKERNKDKNYFNFFKVIDDNKIIIKHFKLFATKDRFKDIDKLTSTAIRHGKLDSGIKICHHIFLQHSNEIEFPGCIMLMKDKSEHDEMHGLKCGLELKPYDKCNTDSIIDKNQRVIHEVRKDMEAALMNSKINKNPDAIKEAYLKAYERYLTEVANITLEKYINEYLMPIYNKAIEYYDLHHKKKSKSNAKS